MFASLKKYYEKNQNVIHYLILALILLSGSFLRFYNLDSVPPALNQDEAINGYDAYAIGNTGRDHHGARQPEPMLQSFDDWSSPLITYFSVPFIKVMGLNVWTVRFPVALLGSFSIFLFYLLIIQLTKNRNYALIGAFILAMSPWSISISRWAIPPSVVPFFLILFLNLFFWALHSKKFTLDTALKFVIAGLSAGILTYAYPTMKLFVPLFVGAMCLIYLRTKFKQLFVMGLVTLVTIAPIYYLTLSNPEKYNARYAATSLSSTGENFVIGFIVRYLEYLSPVFSFGLGDQNTMHHVPDYSSIPNILAIFFYIGVLVVLYKLIKKRESYLIDKHAMYVLLAGLFLFPIADALTKDHFMLLRSIHGFIFITLFIVIGLRFVMEQIRTPNAKRLLMFVIAGLIISSTVAFSFFYFRLYPQTVKSNFNYGLKDTFEYVENHKNEYDKVYIDKDILQIYYLFYSKYDANKLHDKPEDKKFNTYDNGKVIFKPIYRSDLKGAIAVYTVEDRNMYWYGVYVNNNNMYVVKVLRNR